MFFPKDLIDITKMEYNEESLSEVVASRTKRASQEQKEQLISYLEQNLGVATDRFNNLNTIRKYWREIALVLNNLEGPRKTGDQWKRYWFDLRKGTQVRTNCNKASELDTRVLNLIEATHIASDPNNQKRNSKLPLSKPRRILTKRATEWQKLELISYLEKNLDLAVDRCQNPQGINISRKRWRELAIALNSLGGAIKIGEQWRRYWMDLRHHVKARAAKRESIESGNTAKINNIRFSEIDTRIMNIISATNALFKARSINKSITGLKQSTKSSEYFRRDFIKSDYCAETLQDENQTESSTPSFHHYAELLPECSETISLNIDYERNNKEQLTMKSTKETVMNNYERSQKENPELELERQKLELEKEKFLFLKQYKLQKLEVMKDEVNSFKEALSMLKKFINK